MIASFPKYILKNFLQEWLSSKDLLKLLSAHNTDKDDNVQTTMFVYALTALFLKHKSTLDLKYHTRLLGGRSNNALFKVALEDRDFITSLEKSLRSMVADGDYRNSVLDMWTQYRVTIDPSEIHHNSVSTHLIGYLENRGELISYHQLVAITPFISYLEPEEVHPFIEPILAKLSDANSYVCAVALQAITELISKLETTEIKLFIEPIIEPILEKLKDTNPYVRGAALEAITVLISKLKPAEFPAFIKPIIAKLSDANSYVCAAALRAITALISKLETTEIKLFIKPILDKFKDADDEFYGILQVITILISKLKSEELHPFIEPIFEKQLSGANPLVRRAALKAITVLISKLKPEEVHRFIKLILAKLSDPNPLVRSEALKAIPALISKLETTEIKSFTKHISKTLDDADPIVRSAALGAITASISKFEPEDAHLFIKPIVAKLNAAEGEVRSAALRAITALIPKLEPEEAYLFIEPIFAQLNDADPFVRCDALCVISALISKLETTEIKRFIEPVRATLNDTHPFVRIAALGVITALISKLEPVEVHRFIEPIVAKLNDVDKVVRAALGTITAFEPEEVYPFIEPIVAKLNNASKVVRAAALETITVLISKLEQGKSQQFIARVLETLHDKDNSVSYSTLKVEAMRLIDREENLGEIISKLHTLNERDLFALKVMNLLVPKASEADLLKLFKVLKKDLYDTREAIRKEAFNTLSCMIVFHPNFPYKFSNQNASEKEVDLVKMVERQAMTQKSDVISYSNLKTIVGADKTRSRDGQCFDAPDQAIKEMQLLLAMEKRVYTKIEVEAALEKDTDAQRRLGLFENKEVRRSNSDADDISYNLSQKFQCQ